MSIGRTKEEQELTTLLSKTLVQKEVIEPMDKIGWSHANPPAPVYGQPETAGAPATPAAPAAAPASGQPAPAASATPAAAAPAKADTLSTEELVATFESLRDAQGLIMGKYKTIPEALKGAGHLASMAKQAYAERDALRNQQTTTTTTASPQAVTTPVTAPSPEPPSLIASRARLKEAEGALDRVLSSVEDNGGVVDGDVLRAQAKAQRELSEAAAEVRTLEMQHSLKNQESAEQSKWRAVDEFMQTNHPDSLNHAAEIGLHIESDPVLREAVSALVASGKEIAASVLAWQSYQRAVTTGVAAQERSAAELKEADLEAKEQVRKELRDQALKDAGVVKGSSGTGVHMNEDAGAPSRDEMAAVVAQMRNEGEGLGMQAATKFRHMLIGRHLPADVFGNMR